MPVPLPPTLAELKAWLGLDDADTHDDVVLQESLEGALVAQREAVVYPVDGDGTEVFNADLRLAVFLRAQRLAARRNSPEGVVGLQGAGGDFVSARLPGGDSDVWVLEGPHAKVVVS
jgi:hypothetical protein